MRRERGLTLIELAIVLIVLGILLGIGAGIVGVLIKRVKYNESKEIVNAAVEGIVGYANSAGKLPGTEPDLLGTIRSPKDSYGKSLLYIFDDSLDDSSTSVCETSGTNLSLRIGCSDINCTSYVSEINNVAFVVVSGNGNYNIQTGALTGSLNTVSSGQVYIRSVNTSTVIAIYDYGFNAPGNDRFTDDFSRDEPYDDIVKWVTLKELQVALDCPSLSVSITSPVHLPVATEDEPYDYTLEAEGGMNNKWGVMSGGTCDISNSTLSFGNGNWLTLERDTGRLHGVANEENNAPGVLSACTAYVEDTNNDTYIDQPLCVCADINNNNQCDTGEPYDQHSFSLLVKAKPVDLLSQNLPTAREDGTSSYFVKITPLGGSGSYSFSLSSFSPPWDDVDGDGNPDYDHNGDNVADLEMCLDTNDDGTPDCSTPVNTGTAPALIIHGTLPNNDPGTCQGELISFTISASSCSTSDTQGYSITIEDPDCLSGGGGGGGSTCVPGSPITVNNVGGNRTVRAGTDLFGSCPSNFIINPSQCQNFTSVSVGTSTCVYVFTGSNCNNLERVFGYSDASSADTNNDCIVNYSNGVLQDN